MGYFHAKNSMKHVNLLKLSMGWLFLLMACRSSRNTNTNIASSDSSYSTNTAEITRVTAEEQKSKVSEESYEYITIELPESKEFFDNDLIPPKTYPVYFPGTNQKAFDLPAGSKATFGSGKKKEEQKEQKKQEEVKQVTNTTHVEVKKKAKAKTVEAKREVFAGWPYVAIVLVLLLLIWLIIRFSKKK
jgi:cobalamin biosynthesis Mg chelatase CobN